MTTLKMSQPAGVTALDRGVQGVIGEPLDRYEGPLKVSGQATYAYEYAAGTPVAYAYVVTAGIAKARVTGIWSGVARAMPGVIAVIDDPAKIPADGSDTDEKKPAQGGGKVGHFGQPLAVVVAESFEQARAAALAVEIGYDPDPTGQFELSEVAGQAETPPANDFFGPEQIKGDIGAAMGAAAFTLDITYTTPGQIHAAMEPHASLAVWDHDGNLTIYGSYQMLDLVRGQLAAALGISKKKVRIVSRYVGGGFGSKLGLCPDAVLAALAAKETGRPVKLALTRQQLFGATSRRSETIQRIRLASDSDGRLVGVGHDSISGNGPSHSFWEPCGLATVSLYAGENRHITHKLAPVDLLLSASMRAPGEAVGMLALENAMDEMAEKLGLDPIEFRRINEPDRDPQHDLPFSSRALIACFDEGARRFGWERRHPVPRAVREGDWLIGMGVASAARNNLLAQSSALVKLTPDGRAIIECDMTDIGTGTYSVLSQIAGEALGLPIGRIDVSIGDTRHLPSSGSGGSWGAGSAGSAVLLACEALIGKLAKAMDVPADELTLKDGMAIGANRRVPIETLVGSGIEAEGAIQPGSNSSSFSQASYGAHFCEVGVDIVTGEARVRRMLGVYAAGRILNAKTARSQMIGGVVFGIGAALSEELLIDKRHGLFVNPDLAEYHVPVNADVPQIEVHFLDERDEQANPLKAKGIGELGISGAGAAVTNAIYNACGVRVRDYPLTLDKILTGLPNDF